MMNLVKMVYMVRVYLSLTRREVAFNLKLSIKVKEWTVVSILFYAFKKKKLEFN